MKQTDWNARWSDGRIGFHQAEVSDFLTKYSDRVWGSEPLGRVLVPLCGKSLDMPFLADQAEAVIGIEYVHQAVADFFSEQKLSPQVASEEPLQYQAGKYTIFAADFFEVSTEDAGPIDAVFDRASLVALDPETRIKYANHMESLQQTGTKTLLITFDYDQSEMNGPPFAVSDDEVKRLFGEGFRIELLENRDILNQRFIDRGLTAMTESAFALTRK